MGNRVVQGCRRWLGGILLVLLVSSLLPGQPEKPPAKPAEGESPPKKSEAGQEAPTVLPPPVVQATHADTLAHYRHIALQQQPALGAYRASLCAAQVKAEALQKIGGLAALVRKDLDIRKEQVHYGVLSAEANLSVAAWETLYAVTRNYWSAVHAQELIDLAEDALDPQKPTSLVRLRNEVKNAMELVGRRRDLVEWHVTSVDLVLEGILARKIEAEIGLKRAKAALREAMGVPPDFPITLPCPAKLPWLGVAVHPGEVCHAAQTRRGEITLVQAFQRVACLEVQAQEKIDGFRGETFATGSDIHVRSVPLQQTQGEYSPGGVGPEMPGVLAGNREDRVKQARLYADRAGCVVEKTRQLISLQAEDAYLKFQKASQEIEAYRTIVQLAEKIEGEVPGRFFKQLEKKVAEKNPKPDFDDVMVILLKGAQFRLSLHQARYDRLLALTLLERVTAGGVNPGFDEPLPVDQPLPITPPPPPRGKELDTPPPEGLPEPRELEAEPKKKSAQARPPDGPIVTGARTPD